MLKSAAYPDAYVEESQSLVGYGAGYIKRGRRSMGTD